ncbi:hypothetical protein RHGRI_024440 [Rhododendron griersonianum]|uniref:Uncharacterized protein n=1 Tax=Rhododendron griersonianum TaxID=479676 RepID=A0AAV6J755_9ERIC|nr:hypothetical protein RHGRI_024440 [Rhododendron griersonianum]KAG5537002.1 hypothetical protein RHGRI_024440 [Rhododendron griersonianum]
MERLSLHLQLLRFKWGKGERRRRLPVSCPCRRVRGDSLVLQHDGIQGAFCLWLQIGKKISTKERAYGEVLWLVKRTQGHRALLRQYSVDEVAANKLKQMCCG